MGKSLSLGIRERIVALVDEGLSCHQAAKHLRISAASAVRLMRRTSEGTGQGRDARRVAAQI